MPTIQLFLLLLVFACVVAGAFGLMRFFTPSQTQERLRRLSAANHAAPAVDSASAGWIKLLADLTQPLGKLAVPEEGFEKSALKRKFVYAGLRNPGAPTIFFGLKTLLTLGLPLLVFAVVRLGGASWSGNSLLFLLLGLATLGYYAPNIVLDRMVKARQLELFESFPDAVDLMTICVEAGLGTEAAMMRVAEDIAIKSVVLADEMRMVNLELRAGADRERALRNLAFRTGVEEIDSFVTTLIQAERFGTSIAASLRIQSDMLRTRRQQKAEEAAGKIALKLLFPLMFCIFPALMVVLVGPAGLNLMKAFAVAGGN